MARAQPSWRGSTRTVQRSDIEDRALGVGNPTSQDLSSGKAKARWSRVDLTGLDSTPDNTAEVDVPHDLGEIPMSCELVEYENATSPATVIVANAARKENWSHSHVHMNVTIRKGSFNGCQARFLVKGR